MTSYYQCLQRTVHDDGSVTSRYRSTVYAQGAWNEHEQHMAAATGVLAVELEQFQPRTEMRIGRISLDILGLIHAGEFEIKTHIIRAGKTIELVESTMTAQGKTSIVARAWRMQTSDTSSISGLEDKIHHRAKQPWNMQHFWGGGFIQSIRAYSDQRRAGKGIVWLHSDVEMVEGQSTSDFVRLMGLVDAANGIVPRIEQPNDIEWIFPNLDLQIHLYREPIGQWLGLETIQQIGHDGIGLTSSILHDEHGTFGRSEQILTIRKIK